MPQRINFHTLRNDITLMENACTENITKEELSGFRDMHSSLHRNGPQTAGPLASLDHAQQISVISLVSGITKKMLPKKRVSLQKNSKLYI